jgi:hypothetical protein
VREGKSEHPHEDGFHACMKSHYREDVNAPAGAENEVFRTFAGASIAKL